MTKDLRLLLSAAFERVDYLESLECLLVAVCLVVERQGLERWEQMLWSKHTEN